jgi:type I restriction enzyme S subunit
VSGAEISAAHLYRVSADQIIYSRLKAFEGAFAVVPPEGDRRYVSNEFPTFDVNKKKALPAYLRVMLAQPAVWSELTASSNGMGARRERLQVEDFLDYEFDLPDRIGQKIVIAIDARFRESLTALDSEIAAVELVRARLREGLTQDLPMVALRDVLKNISGGRSPKCLDRPPERGEWGVLKTSSVRAGRFDPREAKALPPDVEPFEAAAVRDGDLLTIRASGSRPLVGAVCRARIDAEQVLMSDYHWRLTVDTDRTDPDYFVEAMTARVVREQVADAVQGSTSAGKVSQGRLREVEIPMPATVDAQADIARPLLALSATAAALQDERDYAADVYRSTIHRALTEPARVSSWPIPGTDEQPPKQ